MQYLDPSWLKPPSCFWDHSVLSSNSRPTLGCTSLATRRVSSCIMLEELSGRDACSFPSRPWRVVTVDQDTNPLSKIRDFQMSSTPISLYGTTATTVLKQCNTQVLTSSKRCLHSSSVILYYGNKIAAYRKVVARRCDRSWAWWYPHLSRTWLIEYENDFNKRQKFKVLDGLCCVSKLVFKS